MYMCKGIDMRTARCSLSVISRCFLLLQQLHNDNYRPLPSPRRLCVPTNLMDLADELTANGRDVAGWSLSRLESTLPAVRSMFVGQVFTCDAGDEDYCLCIQFPTGICICSGMHIG